MNKNEMKEFLLNQSVEDWVVSQHTWHDRLSNYGLFYKIPHGDTTIRGWTSKNKISVAEGTAAVFHTFEISEFPMLLDAMRVGD